ncbi:D-glycerate dehydrogenase [Mycolicibacterium sp. P1-18]|uniref:2-hydroxyacid dehydrogenase n=1 Tax=Mycolicibacterium sp. P1-18 TaxID=2024615 RepID=UPI001F5B875B|nr:D-glycerate dehydrogenase [Mycolicibacterium sp. P1-18]
MTTSPATSRPVTGTIYVSRLLTDRAMSHLHSLGAELRVGSEAPPTRSELEAGLAGANAAVITLTERVDADLLAAAGPQLKVIANVAVGFDNVDLSATEAAGVTVTNTPGVLDRASADHTFALILDVTRRITEGDRLIRSRQPWIWGPRMLVGLDVSAGATLGILGYGRIGQAVARRAKAFDMTVIASSRSRTPGTVEDGVTFVDQATLLSESDVVSVHTPLTPETRHLVDAAALKAMKPTAYLINTARGGVVDESALIAALHDGDIRGAALDVFEGEPRVNPALLDAPGLVLTPHTASAGEATRDTMGILAIDNVAAVLSGNPALTPVR